MQYHAVSSHSPPPAAQARVHPLFESSTNTWQFIVADPITRNAVVIDPVLDQDPLVSQSTGPSGGVGAKGGISTTAADHIVNVVVEMRYTIVRILETRAGSHTASSAAWYLRMQLLERCGRAPIVDVGKSLAGVQRMFERKYGVREEGFWPDSSHGSSSSSLGSPGGRGKREEHFKVGNLTFLTMSLPAGPGGEEHTGYLTGNALFMGNSVMSTTFVRSRILSTAGDNKVAAGLAVSSREGIPAATTDSFHGLWKSIQRLIALPADCRVYVSSGQRPVSSYTSPPSPSTSTSSLVTGLDQIELNAMPQRQHTEKCSQQSAKAFATTISEYWQTNRDLARLSESEFMSFCDEELVIATKTLRRKR